MSEYRYTLTRTDDTIPWLQAHNPTVLWIMLNPSTADETQDDPTIRRCRGFTRRLGYPGFTVVNLYALRATNPADLWTALDPVGPNNDQTIREWASTARMEDAPIIAAWGANAKPARVAEVLARRTWRTCTASGSRSPGHHGIRSIFRATLNSSHGR